MEVLVTPRAEKNFDSIVDYLQRNWGEKTVQEFILKVDEFFKLLVNHPLMGSIEANDIRVFNFLLKQEFFTESVVIKSSSCHFLM